jgi:hypothetical protein
MVCLLAGILFFPFVLPFLLVRLILRLVFGLVMLPFVALMVGLGLAIGAIVFTVTVLASLIPLAPFALIALAVWALTRHSRAATVVRG